MQTNYFTYAVPVFIGAMIVEAGVSHFRGKPLYNWSDTFSNVACGMGSQLVGLYLAALTLGFYDAAYDHRVLDLEPNGWIAWVLAILGVDLAYYWYHRLAHEMSFFWATHVVHHQSEEYNLSVALRQSSFAGIYSWVFYLPLAVLGVPPVLYALSYSINLLYQFVIHTRAVDRLGPFEWVLNTPSHHRVHHGSNQVYLDKNYAGMLIIWDRLFGTFTPEREPVQFGLVKPLKSFNPIWANFHYWVDLVRETWRLDGFGNKLLVWVKGPGWQPGDRSPAAAQERAKGRIYEKFVLRAPPAAIAYVFLHFLAVMVGTVVVMAFGQALSEVALLYIYGASLTSMALWQGLLACRTAMLRLEGGRLCLMALATWGVVAGVELPAYVVYALAAYLAVAVVLLAGLYRRRRPEGSVAADQVAVA